MSDEKKLTFEDQIRCRRGTLITGPFNIISLYELFRNIKVEQISPHKNLIDTFVRKSFCPAVNPAVTEAISMYERKVQLKRINSSMRDHMEKCFREEISYNGGGQYSTDKELEELFERNAIQHVELYGDASLIVQLPTGQYGFVNPEDWILLWNYDERDFMERNAVVVCQHEKRSNQFFLPFTP